MQQANEFFASAKPTRLFVKVAIPGMISMLAMSMYLAFEGIFVGHLFGGTAFAAINLGMPVIMINNSLADLVGVGSAVPISVALGRKDEETANNYFTCSVILILLMATFMGIVIFFAAPWFMTIMGAEGTLAELAILYVRVTAVLGPVTTIVFAMDNYLRISGFVNQSMFLNIFMSVLTVAFLALFLGVMGMNVEGAALAASLAMFVCAFLAFIPFVSKKAVLSFVKPQFSMGMIRKIAAYGAPTFLNNIAGRITSILLNAILLRMGGEIAVSVYSVLMYISGVIEPMLYGMSDSAQPAIGYNWGAGSLQRVRDITKVNFMVCGVLSIFCAAIIFIIPEPLARVFIDAAKEPELLALTLEAMPFLALAFIWGWFCFAVQGFFAAIEKPAYATLLSVSFAFIFPVGLIYALQPFGLDGLWCNYAGRSMLTAIVAVVCILKVQKTMRRDIMKYQR